MFNRGIKKVSKKELIRKGWRKLEGGVTLKETKDI